MVVMVVVHTDMQSLMGLLVGIQEHLVQKGVRVLSVDLVVLLLTVVVIEVEEVVVDILVVVQA